METMRLQRKILGVLCALLAPSCIILGLLGNNLPYWYCSISATYYANSKICMIGLLFATSVFFFSYKGYDWKDRLMSLLQAVSALGIIVFPCKTEGIPETVGVFNLPFEVSHGIHCVMAGLLFGSFATNITFLFTLGDESNKQKAKRNMVYRTCGTVIYVFMLLQAMSTALPVPEWFPLTMINEAVMLEAFAVAWLVKAQCWLGDK